MIVDLDQFIRERRATWQEFEQMLGELERRATPFHDLRRIERFHYLYQRVSADLAQVSTFAAEPETTRYLESLVARAYGEIHEYRRRRVRLRPLEWLGVTFPATFRRHVRAFALAVAITLVGGLFGAGALLLDSDAKAVIMPFGHLLGDPGERVAREEARAGGPNAGEKATFSAYLMTHNIRVSIFAFALGLTFGVGTIVLLFYNGVILGAVIADYLAAGEGVFLTAWLLPHGSVEIPAILLAGQAGLVLAGALIGSGDRRARHERLRAIGPDVVTLIGGVALMLVWAGIVEAYLSQDHEPVLPYALKIGFGAFECALLWAWLGLSGRGAHPEHTP